MALSVDPLTYVISIPQADLLPVSGTLYELNVDTFRRALRAWEYSVEGIVQPKTHDHATEVNLGSFTLGRTVKILPPYSITFENGVYTVNLVDAHTNLGDVGQGILNQNSVQVVPPQLPGLVGNRELINQSYLDGKVFINTALGTAAGAGTATDSVPSFALAYNIGQNRNLNSYNLIGTLALGNTDDLVGSRWIGQSPISSIISFTDVDLSGSALERIGITGTLTASPTSRFSMVQGTVGGPSGTTNVWGIFDNVGINGNLTLYSGANDDHYFGDCKSVIAGNVKPIIDCNGTSGDVHFRNYNGGLEIRNFTQGSMSIDGPSMRIKLDSSCTGGEIVIGGTYSLTDNSAGTTVLTDSGVGEIVKNTQYP